MAININQVRSRLQTLQTQTKKQDNLWKPAPGKHVIRIIPYKYNKENPFIELLFHYNLGGKTYLSPQSFGRPDPIVEFADKLKTSGNKDDYKIAKTLEPKLRTFTPIIIRGKESEGAKFWGFGKTVYSSLLELISDPEYGDITDIVNGHDVTVTFKAAEQPGKSFPTTTITPRPSKTKITDNHELLKAIFESQKNILDIYKELSYDDLEAVLKTSLDGGKQQSSNQPDDVNDTDVVEETAAQYAKVNKSSNDLSSTSISSNNIESELDALFESK